MIKDIAVFVLGIVGLVYLFNPGAGIFEAIPDNIPYIGNLDEAVACALVLAVFRYFGVDLTTFLEKSLHRNPKDKEE
ncbi:MAG: DUF1232 domain-containing protein [Nitrospinota bacterium]|nr:DUF1232 domain-containing protein [Nitrospinota bacterium]